MTEECTITAGTDTYPYQIFMGKKYHLYTGEKYYSRGTNRLHVVVYRNFYGDIPPGFHVHHKDENVANNHPNNLECLPVFDHLSSHMNARDKDELRARMDYAREFAKSWHSSPEGLEWHRNHGFSHKQIEKKCLCCSKSYITVAVNENGHSAYCSNNCKSQARRLSGVDNIQKICPVCGKTYIANKYSRSVTCGRLCGGIIRKKAGITN